MNEKTGRVPLRVGAATSRGRIRELNEDVFLVREARGLFLVCDGMGGAPAGEVASQIAASTIINALEDPLPPAGTPLSHANGYRAETNRLAAAVRRSNQVIFEQGCRDPQRANMGTTTVAALIIEHMASVAHVGDSRAYLWRDGHLEQLTRDHSLGEALRTEGLSGAGLSADQENSLMRVLGGEADVEIDLTEVPLRFGDYLLLCSDGLTRLVPERMLGEAMSRLREPQRICDHLVDVANRNGGTDNVTVVVIEVGGSWWRRLAKRFGRNATGAHDGKARAEI